MKFLKGAMFGMASAAVLFAAYNSSEMLSNNKKKIMRVGKKAIKRISNKII